MNLKSARTSGLQKLRLVVRPSAEGTACSPLSSRSPRCHREAWEEGPPSWAKQSKFASKTGEEPPFKVNLSLSLIPNSSGNIYQSSLGLYANTLGRIILLLSVIYILMMVWHKAGAKGIGSGTRPLPGFKSLLCLSLAVWPWAHYLTSLCLRFFRCKRQIILLPSRSCCEDCRSSHAWHACNMARHWDQL